MAEEKDQVIMDSPGHYIHEDFLLAPLTQEYCASAAELYTRVFLEDEPTTRRFAIDPNLFLPFADFYVSSLVQTELSFIAYSKKNTEIVGFIFCCDFTSDLQAMGDTMAQFLDFFSETVHLMEDLEKIHVGGRKIFPGQLLHIFQIGVDRKYRRTGVAKALIHQVAYNGYEKGFQQVIADCTSGVSAHSFYACGFRRIGGISYESWNINTNPFFASLEGEITLVVKDIR